MLQMEDQKKSDAENRKRVVRFLQDRKCRGMQGSGVKCDKIRWVLVAE